MTVLSSFQGIAGSGNLMEVGEKLDSKWNFEVCCWGRAKKQSNNGGRELLFLLNLSHTLIYSASVVNLNPDIFVFPCLS